jgi:hypothetical protein
LEPDRRLGVSTYIETFILIGIAIGGSAIVYSAMGGYAASAGGPSVAVSNVALSQSSDVAVEKVTISNAGTTSFAWFTVRTAGVSSSLSYCAELSDSTGKPIGFSSPPPACGSGTATNPGSITITPTTAIPPGQAVILTVVVSYPSEFTIGASYSVTVSTSAGALQVVAAAAVPG